MTSTAAFDASPILIDVVRNGFVESVHRGRMVVTSPDGHIEASVGDVTAPFYPRSANKPMQALAMLRSGLDVQGALLALCAASHSGEDFHLVGVREILAGAGLGVDALQNTPDYPVDETARDAWIRSGHGKESLSQNCSGKHAGMLRTCVRAGWSTEDHLDPTHPLQVEVAATVAELAGEASSLGIDGCGAPLFAMPLQGLAHAFGRFAGAGGGDLKLIADACRHHPEYVSGTGREELSLHRAVPGLMVKGGAEGCVALGLADGRGMAIKVDDGNPRGVYALASAVLKHLGHAHPLLDALSTPPVLGHGQPVGVIKVHDGVVAQLFA